MARREKKKSTSELHKRAHDCDKKAQCELHKRRVARLKNKETTKTACGRGGTKGNRRIISSSKGMIRWITQAMEGRAS